MTAITVYSVLSSWSSTLIDAVITMLEAFAATPVFCSTFLLPKANISILQVSISVLLNLEQSFMHWHFLLNLLFSDKTQIIEETAHHASQWHNLWLGNKWKMILLCLHLAEEVCSNYNSAVLWQVWKLTDHHIFEEGYNISEKRMWSCEKNSAGSGQDPVIVFCKDSNEPSGTSKIGIFFFN